MALIKRPTIQPKVPIEVDVEPDLHTALTQYRDILSQWLSAQPAGTELEKMIDPEVEKKMKTEFVKHAIAFQNETTGDPSAVFPDELQGYLVKNKPIKRLTPAERKAAKQQEKILAIEQTIGKLEKDRDSTDVETTDGIEKKKKIEERLKAKRKALEHAKEQLEKQWVAS